MRDIFQWQPGWFLFTLRLLFANSVLGLFLYWAAAALPIWLNWDWQQRFLHILFLGVIYIFIYISCLWISGLRFHDLKAKT